MRRLIILLALLVSQPGLIYGYQNEVDSLRKLLTVNQTVEDKLNILDELSWQLRSLDIDSAIFYAHKGIELSNQYHHSKISAFHNTLGIIHRQRNEYDSALSHYKEMIKHAKVNEVHKSIAVGYMNLGVLFKKQNQTDSALYYYQLGKKVNFADEDSLFFQNLFLHIDANIATVQQELGLVEKALDIYKNIEQKAKSLNNEHLFAQVYFNIGNIYNSTEEVEFAKYYFQKSLDFELLTNNIEGIIDSYSSLLRIEESLLNFDNALRFGKTALRLADQYKLIEKQALITSNLGDLYTTFSKFDSAQYYFDLSYDHSLRSNSKYYMRVALQKKGMVNIFVENFENAQKFSFKCLKLLEEFDFPKIRENVYNDLARYFLVNRDIKSFNHYESLRNELLLERINAKRNKQLFEIETKYETEKKEKEILRLGNERQAQALQLAQNRTVQYGMGAGILLLLLSGLFFWRDRQRRLLIARYEAEESEKHRIARELHDGLAGEILLIQRSIPDQLPQLQANLLRANRDLRNFSHQLDAKRKSRSPLPDILSDYINHNGLLDQLQISVDFFPKPFDVLDGELKSNLFRIWQELLTNTLKHSGASHCSLQLAFINKKIEINYEDNGVGVNAGEEQQGLGLSHIRERVGLLKGKVYQMEKESGFSIKMEIPVKKSSVVYS